MELHNLINSYQLKAEFRGRKRLLDFPLYVSFSYLDVLQHTHNVCLYI